MHSERIAGTRIERCRHERMRNTSSPPPSAAADAREPESCSASAIATKQSERIRRAKPRARASAPAARMNPTQLARPSDAGSTSVPYARMNAVVKPPKPALWYEVKRDESTASDGESEFHVSGASAWKMPAATGIIMHAIATLTVLDTRRGFVKYTAPTKKSTEKSTRARKPAIPLMMSPLPGLSTCTLMYPM